MKQSLSALRTRHAAFTLVELLVVIGIIAALASLLLVAGAAAMRAAREAAIKTEAGQLAEGFTAYANDVSAGAYPPNLCVAADGANPSNDFTRHFNKAFPQHREPKALIDVLARGVNQGNFEMIGTPASIGVTPYEAIAFWIGGFSSDPKYPISGPGGPSFITNNNGTEDFAARGGFDFDETRLGPRNDTNMFDGRYVTYPDPQDTTGNTIRRINLWQYFPTNLTKPYVYFDASTTPKSNIVFDVLPIPMAKLNASGTPLIRDLRLANDGKCQILAAGLDDAWGEFSEVDIPWANKDASNPALLYPDGPWTGEIADTITNFSTARTLEKSQP